MLDVGSFEYFFELGQRDWNDVAGRSTGAPFDRHTPMRLASCTKLLTAIAALQCVELGLLHLDNDIGDVIPQLKSRDIVSLDSDGKLQYRPKTRPITLR